MSDSKHVLFFPTCQVRVARFYQNSSSSFFSSSSPSVSPILFAKCLANPLRQASRQSSLPSVSPIRFAKYLANTLRQVSRRSSLQVRIAASTAGPQPQRPERSEHRWTSIAKVPAQSDFAHDPRSQFCFAANAATIIYEFYIFIYWISTPWGVEL